jgi:hypothetical protein
LDHKDLAAIADQIPSQRHSIALELSYLFSLDYENCAAISFANY